MNNTQLLKGILEGCVLLVISEEEVYGYELVQKLKGIGFSEIIGGTVYPLLQKLEKKGYLKSKMKPSTEGPNRKYYFLTPEGNIASKEFVKEWQLLEKIVNQIIMKTGGDNHEQY